jgi:hypothetical protein
MNTNIHFWSYLAQLFLELEMFQTKVVKKLKTHTLCSVILFSKIVPFMRQWKPNSTNIHAGCVILICFFHCNNVCKKAPQCFVICTLPVLYLFFWVFPRRQTPEKYPKEKIQYSKHGESLKSRIACLVVLCNNLFSKLLVTVTSIEKKVKQSLDRPYGFQEVELPRFQDNRYMEVVRLSALNTGSLYPSGNIPGS